VGALVAEGLLELVWVVCLLAFAQPWDGSPLSLSTTNTNFFRV
jgi:hypothetical protein